MAELIVKISSIVWSAPLIILAILTGIYFTVSSKFLQVRSMKEMLRLIFTKNGSDIGISSFQALAVSLANRVGTGNVAGVATAIAIGGPGSVFWMWLIAFFGAATSFAESTLAQIYKVRVGKEFRGGSSFYIEKGLGSKTWAILFAISIVLAFGFATPGVQSTELANAMKNAFGITPLITGIIVSILTALVIFGGVKRIAKVAEIIVPFMAIVYVIVAISVIAVNISELPNVLALIFRSAFGMDATFGGILGSAIAWGVKRGIYSNEAGQGSAPPFAGAANVSHPAKQGYVQAFSIYIDTLIVCSATAFMILITGMYNVEDGRGGLLSQGLNRGVDAGSTFTQAAVDSVFPGFGQGIVAIVLSFFVFTTILGNYYSAEVHAGYLQEKFKQKWIIAVLRLAVVFTVITSTFYSAKTAWALGDIGIGLMAWINFIAILLLSKTVFKTLRDYELQKAEGKDPVFDPVKLGIKNADYWENEIQKAQGKDAEFNPVKLGVKNKDYQDNEYVKINN